MRRIVLSIALIALVVGSVLACLSYLPQRQAELEFKAMKQYQTDDPFYKWFLQKYFSDYDKGQEICVDSTYKVDCVNILVVDIPRPIPIKAEIYLNNMNALGSNVIIVDKSFIDLLLLSSNYAMKSRLISAMGQNKNWGPFAVLTLWGQQYTQVYRQHDRYLHNVASNGSPLEANDETLESEIVRVKRGLVSFEGITIPKEFSNVRQAGALPHIIEVMGTGLLFEHEMGHLSINPYRRMVMRVQSIWQYGLAGSLKKEEDLVDARAFAKIGIITKKFSRDNPIFGESDIELSALYANFLFFWVDGSFKFFDGRRGLAAEDFMFEINFKQCQLDDSFYALIPDQVAAMAPAMQQGRMKPLPVMTAEEYKQFRSELSESRTHSHSMIRAANILDQITKRLKESGLEMNESESVGIRSGLLQSALYDKPPAPIGSSRTPLSYAVLAKALSGEHLKHQAGELCPTHECDVWEGDDAVVEVLRSGDGVEEVRATSKTNGKSLVGFFAALVAINTVLKLDLHELIEDLSTLKVACPGFFWFEPSLDQKQFVLFEKLATPDHMALRYRMMN